MTALPQQLPAAITTCFLLPLQHKFTSSLLLVTLIQDQVLVQVQIQIQVQVQP